LNFNKGLFLNLAEVLNLLELQRLELRLDDLRLLDLRLELRLDDLRLDNLRLILLIVLRIELVTFVLGDVLGVVWGAGVVVKAGEEVTGVADTVVVLGVVTIGVLGVL
jgi:hypothetical protein